MRKRIDAKTKTIILIFDRILLIPSFNQIWITWFGQKGDYKYPRDFNLFLTISISSLVREGSFLTGLEEMRSLNI